MLKKQQTKIINKINDLDIDIVKMNNYKKYFEKIPRLVKLLINKYQFNEKKILDIGSNYGNSLLYWGKESEGIEARDECIKFLSKMDKKVYKLNIEEDFYQEISEKYDAIYTNNLLEHVIAPHYFLAQLHHLLNKDGILAIGHPVVPTEPYNTLWQKFGYKGWLASEHINFFTPDTIKLILERSGFEVIQQYCSPYYIFGIHNMIGFNGIIKNSSIQVMTVARRVDYKYGNKRIKEFDPLYTNIFNEYR